MTKQEIEYKYLLIAPPKKLSTLKEVDSSLITQVYTPDGTRYRHYSNDYSWASTYEKIKKTPINAQLGEYSEEWFDITKEEYLRVEENRELPRIAKRRHTYRNRSGLRFEVDVFSKARLTILEVEVPIVGYTFDMPPELHSLKLMEVTGRPEFSNYELAKRLMQNF